MNTRFLLANGGPLAAILLLSACAAPSSGRIPLKLETNTQTTIIWSTVTRKSNALAVHGAVRARNFGAQWHEHIYVAALDVAGKILSETQTRWSGPGPRRLFRTSYFSVKMPVRNPDAVSEVFIQVRKNNPK